MHCAWLLYILHVNNVKIEVGTRLGSHIACAAKSMGYYKVQPTVMFPIGDYVKILDDYKKTRPSKILKLLIYLCHHLIDVLIEFSQSRTSNFFKCLNVPYR